MNPLKTLLAILSGVALLAIPSVRAQSTETGPSGATGSSDGENPNLIELSWSRLQPASVVAEFGAAQEAFEVFERYLRGEGLPEMEQRLFADSYNELAATLVSDQIDEPTGRIFKERHRNLLEKAHQLLANSRDFHGDFATHLQNPLENLREEVRDEARSPEDIPTEIRTPSLNGQQFWMEDVVLWGRQEGRISAGQYSRLARAALELEELEARAKSEGAVSSRDRDELHEQAVKLNRLVVNSVRK